MKRIMIIALLAVCNFVSKAQDRATTVNEYNYLVNGKYDFMLPGYRLTKSNVDERGDYSDASREIIVWEFYRPGAGSPCALMLEYRNSLHDTQFLCVPDINSPSQLWQAYHQALRDINNNLGTNALELIAYTMSKYAAGH